MANDKSSEQNKLVSQPMEQRDSYRVRGADFPVKSVKAVSGAGGSKGDAEGSNKLVPQSTEQRGPRFNAGDGPAEWGREGKQFSVSVNKGESDESPSSVSIPESINCATGKIEGGKAPKVGGAFDSKL